MKFNYQKSKAKILIITEKIEVEICSLLDSESKDGLSSKGFANPKIAPTQVLLEFQKHWKQFTLNFDSQPLQFQILQWLVMYQ